MSEREQRLETALRKAINFLRSAPLASGLCCCGNPIEGHGYTDGHSPVDAAQYHADQLAEQFEEELR